MNPEDAIDWFNTIMPKWDSEANIYGAESYYGTGRYICTEPEGYLFKEAIEALEKQGPKKIKYISDGYANCPVCEAELDGCNYYSYCPYCGQAIDWCDESGADMRGEE